MSWAGIAGIVLLALVLARSVRSRRRARQAYPSEPVQWQAAAERTNLERWGRSLSRREHAVQAKAEKAARKHRHWEAQAKEQAAELAEAKIARDNLRESRRKLWITHNEHLQAVHEDKGRLVKCAACGKWTFGTWLNGVWVGKHRRCAKPVKAMAGADPNAPIPAGHIPVWTEIGVGFTQCRSVFVTDTGAYSCTRDARHPGAGVSKHRNGDVTWAD